MTLHQVQPRKVNERTLRDLARGQYRTLVDTQHAQHPELPYHPHNGVTTKLIKLVTGPYAPRTQAERLRLAGTLWAVSQVLLRDTVSDKELPS